MLKKFLCIGVLLLLLATLACSVAVAPSPTPPGPPVKDQAPAKQGWEADWEKTLAGAKQDGRVTIYTTASSSTRQTLSEEFGKKFALEVQFVSGRGSEVVEKLSAERRAGLFLADLYIGGATTPTTGFKTLGFLAPLKPLIVLPEIKDPKVWYGGELFFTDKEKQYVACPVLTASNNYVSTNTELVKAGEVTSYQDLLNPKWKGKIIINDPTIAGAGSRWFAVVADQFTGLDYMRELVKNQPALTRDQRLQVEGLARGKYAIAIGVQPDIQAEFIKFGAPIKTVIPKEGAWLGGGPGLIAYFDRSPHPAATRVFVNWFL
ncbi:MAG: extracellular solute-binding protein, partial [Chloroflexi bacterium]|nr:extracellular solute-binding protein [Chloroflexota bacterium]